MLNVQNLTYKTRNKTLLDSVNFSLTKGKITGVLGANGAGKSTLIKLLSGDITPQNGVIAIGGKALNKWCPKELAFIRAIMGQKHHLTFEFSVFDYLALSRGCVTEDKKERITIIAEIMNRLNLMDFSLDSINQLSGGELQRVMFARAWLQIAKPNDARGKLLLLDEPTSALDIRQQQAFFNYVSQFCQLGGTVLCVLHDINSAAQYCEDLLFIKKGKQISFGPVRDTFTCFAIQECFDIEGEIYYQNKSHIPQFITCETA